MRKFRRRSTRHPSTDPDPCNSAWILFGNRPPRSMVLALWLAWLSGCMPTPVPQSTPEVVETGERMYPIVVHPASLSLGTLRPGQTAEAGLRLQNLRGEAVDVDHVEVSCPCVSLAPSSFNLTPRGFARVTVAFDPSGESDFRGKLSIIVRGMDAGGGTLFQTRVALAVQDDAELEGPWLPPTETRSLARPPDRPEPLS
jgi:hypothetical protein